MKGAEFPRCPDCHQRDYPVQLCSEAIHKSCTRCLRHRGYAESIHVAMHHHEQLMLFGGGPA